MRILPPENFFPASSATGWPLLPSTSALTGSFLFPCTGAAAGRGATIKRMLSRKSSHSGLELGYVRTCSADPPERGHRRGCPWRKKFGTFPELFGFGNVSCENYARGRQTSRIYRAGFCWWTMYLPQAQPCIPVSRHLEQCFPHRFAST